MLSACKNIIQYFFEEYSDLSEQYFTYLWVLYLFFTIEFCKESLAKYFIFFTALKFWIFKIKSVKFERYLNQINTHNSYISIHFNLEMQRITQMIIYKLKYFHENCHSNYNIQILIHCWSNFTKVPDRFQKC